MEYSPIRHLKDLVGQLDRYFSRRSKDFDVSFLKGPQGFVVVYLSKRGNQETRIKDIEENLKVSKSVASDLIKRMEKNGFIRILPSQLDKRAKDISLTPLGLEKAASLGQFYDAVKREVFEGIQHEDLLTVKRVFDQIHKNLEKRSQ